MTVLGMDLEQCDWSDTPRVLKDQKWPKSPEVGKSAELVADMYPQPLRVYVPHERRTLSSRVEVQMNPAGEATCRIVQDLSVIERLAELFCVRVYKPIRWKGRAQQIGAVVGVGGLIVGSGGTALLGLHVIGGTAAWIMGTGAGVAGIPGVATALLTPTLKANRNRALKPPLVFPVTVRPIESRAVDGISLGAWRVCHDRDGSHDLCVSA